MLLKEWMHAAKNNDWFSSLYARDSSIHGRKSVVVFFTSLLYFKLLLLLGNPGLFFILRGLPAQQCGSIRGRKSGELFYFNGNFVTWMKCKFCYNKSLILKNKNWFIKIYIYTAFWQYKFSFQIWTLNMKFMASKTEATKTVWKKMCRSTVAPRSQVAFCFVLTVNKSYWNIK